MIYLYIYLNLTLKELIHGLPPTTLSFWDPLFFASASLRPSSVLSLAQYSAISYGGSGFPSDIKQSLYYAALHCIALHAIHYTAVYPYITLGVVCHPIEVPIRCMGGEKGQKILTLPYIKMW